MRAIPCRRLKCLPLIKVLIRLEGDTSVFSSKSRTFCMDNSRTACMSPGFKARQFWSHSRTYCTSKPARNRGVSWKRPKPERADKLGSVPSLPQAKLRFIKYSLSGFCPFFPSFFYCTKESAIAGSWLVYFPFLAKTPARDSRRLQRASRCYSDNFPADRAISSV
jgi:hypothetical protein